MKCSICRQGVFQKGSMTVTFEKSGSTVVFKDVPAMVCTVCEEKILADDMVKILESEMKKIVEGGLVFCIRTYRHTI